jgi:uncharacterized damage-inducible protein DinB
MTPPELDALRYPVGRFSPSQDALDADERRILIDEIALTPGRLRNAVDGLDEPQLETRYRPDGWTVCQVVHHVPDSHMNAYTRFKIALTEERPTIRTYDEAAWARLADADNPDVDVSLDLLDALHERWVTLLRSLDDADWSRPFVHPEIGEVTLDFLLQLYAWHGRHHVAHVTSLREREGW